ncbi:MAG: GAF domain-containing protein, partial [Rhodobacterales bacterium]|nr:GAF domain-containing protein [Rhodobacterales bacterium]
MTNHQAVLARIARQLSNDLNLDTVLGPILRMLAEETGLARVALSRVDWVSEEVVILAGHGLTPAEVRRGRYAFGEGIIGRVVQSGQARVVPSIAAEPHFLDRTGALTEGTDRAFICVPILLDGQVVGALSAYRSPAPPDELGVDLDLLAILAGLTAPAVQQIATPQRVSTHHNSPWRPPHMIGSSRVMMSVYELIDQVAGSPTTVMLRGESGTGKELVAQAIHGHSPRRRAPFIKVNCAALPENLIESELFGHERGAFTGAHQQRKGRFELAHGGTLFLDEIGDLSPATQIKLLRVLQEREFERVGGNRTVRVDVRLVTATSCDRESMMDDGT